MHPTSWDSFRTKNNGRNTARNSNTTTNSNSISNSPSPGRSSDSVSQEWVATVSFPPLPIITPHNSTLQTAAAPLLTGSGASARTDIISINTAPRPPSEYPPSYSSLASFTSMDPLALDIESDLDCVNDETLETGHGRQQGNAGADAVQDSEISSQQKHSGGDHPPVANEEAEEGGKKKRKRKPPAVPWKKPKDMPRRPLSAYNLFFKERREAMMKAATAAEDQQRTPTFGRRKSNKSVGIGFANLARTIASEWKTLDPTTKAPYEARAAAEKSRYDKEMLVWRAKQKQEKAAAAAAAPKVESEKISSSSSAFNVPQVKTSQASGRDSDLQGASFQASMPASSGMQDSSSMMHSMQLPFPTASMMDEMMMMSQQYPYQQQRQGMMGWTGLHSPISSSSNTGRPSVVSRSSAVQMAELSNEAVRTVSGSQPQGFMHEHMNPSLAHGRQQLMWEQSRSMASGDGQSDILARDSSNITAASPAMFEEFQQQQSHFFPGPAHSNGERVPMSASLSRGVNPHRQGQTMEQAGAFAERRNTWSGMSQAQQDAFHQMRMEQIRQEEEFLKEQLLEHRRRYMEHERQLQEERRRRVSLQIQNEEGFGDISREIEPMAAHHVGQHPDSWTELRSLPDRSNVLPNSAIAVPSLPVQHQHQHQSSSEFYPSAWFEADSNVEGTRNNIDDSSIRYTPGNDGELNQKVSAKSSANAISSSAFGSQQGDGVPKKGKKPDADPWNPLQFKERESVFGNVEPHHLHHHPLQQSIEDGKTGDASGPGGPNEPTLDNVNVHLGDRPEGAPVQNAGMHLDDETMTFLSHLRFGGGLNTPDRSPTRGDRS